MIYELREYKASEGMVEALHRRFRESTLSLFAKHGIEVVGFWTFHEDSQVLAYMCRFANKEARDAAWNAFNQDAEWQEIKKTSEANGPLTVSMTSVLLDPVPYVEAL